MTIPASAFEEFRNTLRDEVAAAVLTDGFYSIGNLRPAFRRELGRGLQSFTIVDGWKQKRLTPSFLLSVRIDLIEKIHAVALGQAAPSESSLTVVEVEHWPEPSDTVPKVKTMSDISAWLPSFTEVYQHILLPALAKFSDIGFLASDPSLNINPVQPSQGWRVARRLIAAKLAKVPNFDDIRRTQEQLLADYEWGVDEYFTVADFLNRKSLDEILEPVQNLRPADEDT